MSKTTPTKDPPIRSPRHYLGQQLFEVDNLFIGCSGRIASANSSLLSWPLPSPSARSVHLQGLDVLRAVAISLVLLFHYPILFAHPDGMGRWTSFGWTGVDLFFVLSGYLISSQLLAAKARRGISLESYFIKRSFRILPLFWLTLAAYFLMPAWRETEALAPLWKFLTFTQNLYFDPSHQRTFSHAWSLCIEEQFYLVLPFILLWVGHRQTLKGTLMVVATLMVLGFGIRWVSWETLVAPAAARSVTSQGGSFISEWARWIYYCTQTRLDGLLTGVAVASLFHFREEVKSWCFKRAWYFAVTAVAGLIGAVEFSTPFHTHACALYGYPLISLSYGCLLIAVLSPRFQLPRALFFPFKWLATLSYGIYLTHKMVAHVAQSALIGAGFDGNGYPLLFACFAAFVIVGLMLHWLVERPMFAVRDRVLRREKITAENFHPQIS